MALSCIGINVFKVREVLQCPNLTLLPKSNPIVRGIASVRARTIPVIDLSLAIGRDEHESLHDGFVIIAEYNMKEQGFLVGAVERIINLNWEGYSTLRLKGRVVGSLCNGSHAL